jgi:hypothetical protein
MKLFAGFTGASGFNNFAEYAEIFEVLDFLHGVLLLSLSLLPRSSKTC